MAEGKTGRVREQTLLIAATIFPSQPVVSRRVLFARPLSCYNSSMEIKLTAVFRKFPEGYAAFVEELPGANTQGATLEEARENLKEAVAMVLQANRELAEESLRGADVVRERLPLTTA
jgi:predicted RNase H-like HicB family nuclease